MFPCNSTSTLNQLSIAYAWGSLRCSLSELLHWWLRFDYPVILLTWKQSKQGCKFPETCTPALKTEYAPHTLPTPALSALPTQQENAQWVDMTDQSQMTGLPTHVRPGLRAVLKTSAVTAASLAGGAVHVQNLRPTDAPTGLWCT